MRALYAWSVFVVFVFAFLPYFAFAAALKDSLACSVEAKGSDYNTTAKAGRMVEAFDKRYMGAGHSIPRTALRVARDDSSPTTSSAYPTPSSTDSPQKSSLVHQGLVAILGLVAVVVGIFVLLCLFHVAGRSMGFSCPSW